MLALRVVRSSLELAFFPVFGNGLGILNSSRSVSLQKIQCSHFHTQIGDLNTTK